MEQIMNYVKPELVVVAIVLYFIGMWLKKAETVTDKYIPIILGAAGIAICGIYVVATCSLSGVQNIAMAVLLVRMYHSHIYIQRQDISNRL